MEKRLDQFQIGANFQRSMMQAEITELEKKIERLQFVINLQMNRMCEDCKQKLTLKTKSK
jgi:hypothetical protein